MQLDKTIAQGRWAGILRDYGLNDKQISGKHTACPLCGGNDRFRFDDKDGKGTWYCNQCGAGDGYALVMKLTGGSFKDTLSEIASKVGHYPISKTKSRDDPEKVRAQLRKIMDNATREVINPYLANRGITVKPNVFYTNSLLHWDDGVITYHPAMLAIIQDTYGNRAAIHRTYLTATGKKADVKSPKMLTKTVTPISGGAIRLFQHDGCLGVAEGIETACAATQLFGVPTWAAFSASMLEAFSPPQDIKKIIIFSDNDVNFTGQNAAFSLARRLKLQGVDVEVQIPEKPDTDWADYLAETLMG